MLRLNEVKLPLNHDADALPAAILARLAISADALLGFTVYKRSYDARKRSSIVLIYALDVDVVDEDGVLARLSHDVHLSPSPDTSYHFVANGVQLAANAATRHGRPVVIGSGPCGLFAALILAQMGLRPIIVERGKQVRERTVDTFGFWRKRELNPESNVQFGEGGAGTFSDGKLYSQIKDPRHYGRKVLKEFVLAGAPEEILYVSKPHIGTFRLVKMVEQMRANIEAMGGEYRFDSKVVDIEIEANADGDGGQVRSLTLAGGERIVTEHVVLAIGHSARDTFEMLYERGVYIEAKP
ncbi:FAD-dependent monooxygenase, partial [Rugamonas sp.]|uniref:NAD(P)/FAD-dependent oxidoreductase n=1 Tax=Rugamonas sp. TaxID=1926287 RepID=UPI0025EA97EE